MHIFIDESGIHKRIGRSTVALVCVAVQEVENLNEAILKFEKYYKIKPFHWSKFIWRIRRDFLIAICREKFIVKIALLNNPFSEEILESALIKLLTGERINKIIIDGRKPSRYVLKLKKILRDHNISVKKIRMGDDKSFPCLRLADLFAGLIRVYFEEPDNQEAKKLFDFAKNKIATQILGGQDTD